MLKSSILYKIAPLALLTYMLLHISCRKDLDFDDSGITTFRFSQDTVFMDTVFTQANSETFLVKIYNDTDQDVLIPNLYLNKRNESKFRINVDGRTGYEFEEVPVRGKDSLMVFVEIALGNENQDWLAEDEIVFANQQQIKLLAAVEDAIYYYPKQGEEFIEINSNTQWNAQKSHIIYGKLRIDENTSLQIEPGTKVYFHQNSLMQLERGAHLIAQGSRNSKIIFRTDRQSPRYDTLPKQWETIQLLPGSSIEANYLTIKGARNGLSLNEALANLDNVEIYNAGSSGIFSKNSTILGTNVVISDAADASLNIENGGQYTFYFSTFANAGQSSVVGSSGPNIPLYVSDYTLENDTEVTQPLQATFVNSIFYGRYANGVVVDVKDDSRTNLFFESCLIKNEDPGTISYIQHPAFNQTIIDKPWFVSTIFSNQNLRLQEQSPAIGKANPNYINYAPTDLDGNVRSNAPSIGAYD